MAVPLRLRGIRELLTLEPALGTCPESPPELGLVRDAALDLDASGRVLAVGPAAALAARPAAAEVDLGGAVVLPGLIDCHTHLVFAGVRTVDFAARAAGLSYEEVARRGGGIRTTVAATRAADPATLLEGARARALGLAQHGVTTVEVKTGYGLGLAEELRLLEVVAELARQGPLRIEPTLMALHVLPDTHAGDRAGYLAMVQDELLPEVARRGLARFVDVFCDVGAFTLEESVSVLTRARELGFLLKVHAEQLTRTGVSAAAALLGAVSADHLEHAAPEDIRALAQAGTTAVLLPSAAIFLGGKARAPARALLDAGVGVALSTDCNPGSCPSTHLPLVTTLACTWLGLRPEEALVGVTRAAAKALALSDARGTLVPGAPADLAISRLPSWREISYWMGASPFAETWVAGRRILPPVTSSDRPGAGT